MMSKPQQIFLQSHQMMVEHLAECVETESHQKVEAGFSIDDLIGVNQNLPSAGVSTPELTLSRTESFTFEEELPWTAARKYSFEMIDTSNQNLKETPKSKMDGLLAFNSVLAQPESIHHESRVLQKARSHSITSIEGCIPQEASSQHQNVSVQAKPTQGSTYAWFESDRRRLVPVTNHRSAAAASVSLSQTAEVCTTKTAPLPQIFGQAGLFLQAKETLAYPTDASAQTDTSRFECFDFEEQMSLANASIPEGKNGKVSTDLSAEKHFDLRQEHDLQPDRLGARVQDHISCLCVRSPQQRPRNGPRGRIPAKLSDQISREECMTH